MSDLIDFGNLELSSTSLSQFLIGFIVTIFLSLLLRLIYIKYSDSVSNKLLIANIFPLFGVSIFLIVITIKSSIVLSLGLVGALSIIRFRTVIKDTKDTAFVFLALAAGMAAGTTSHFLAIAGTLVTSIVAYILYTTNYGSIYSSEFILRFRLNQSQSSDQPDYIKVLEEYAQTSNLLHIEPSGDSLTSRLTFDVMMKKDKTPEDMSSELSKLDEVSELIIVASEHDIDY